MEKRNKKLNIIAIGILLFILPILYVVSGELRPSISDYVYSSAHLTFAILLTFAGAVFIYNGVQDDDTIIGKYKANSKWYNIVTGLALIGVVATPHLHYPIAHYTCAAVFFGSGFVNMILFSNHEDRFIKAIACFISIGVLVSSFFGHLSLAVAEQIALIPIALNLTLEILNKTK
jgi:putative Mn2+ efflux pump MntP